MKLKIFTLIPLLLTPLISTDKENIFDINLTTIKGEHTTLKPYKGNVLMIVNTASECGFTPQFKDLQKIYETYSDEGFVVLGFPANNFGGQEPGSDEEIMEFCEVNYGVSFPLFSKVSVKGDDIHPLFDQLTNSDNPDFTGEINWNFEKFLIDRNGNLVRRFKSNENPTGKEISEALQTII